jgi:predicted PurR-regulated permease PerM
MANRQASSSPRWSTTTKIVVTLLILAGVIALLIRFAGLINTLITAFIFAVLFHPIAEFVNRKTGIPWTWSVSIIYLITVVIVFGLLTVGGIALINQINELIRFLQTTLEQLPGFIEQLTTTTFTIGPFDLDFSYINWEQIGNQLLSSVQPALTRLGNLFGSVATGAVGFVGSFLLSLLISFLIITETEEASDNMIKIEIPGYQEDFERLGCKIKKTWNQFLRGQALIFLFRFFLYLIILTVFQLRFVLGMALLATLGNFIPYIGVAIVWIIIFFVAFFQGSTAFGMEPFAYAITVMAVGWISDNLYDTFFSPKYLGGVLKLHPAAVLVAVLVGLNLFGILGMFLAPPTLATIRLLWQYANKKLQDKDPWEEEYEINEDTGSPTFFGRIAVSLRGRIREIKENKEDLNKRKEKEKNEGNG